MNLADFFSMGGYALYVWGAYGITALFMAVEVILVVRRRRAVLRRLERLAHADTQADQQ